MRNLLLAIIILAAGRGTAIADPTGLLVNGTLFDPGPGAQLMTSGVRQTLRTGSQTLAGLSISAEVTSFAASATVSPSSSTRR